LKDKDEIQVGIIGLQMWQEKFFDLLPSSVLEEPYEVSFITIFSAQTDEVTGDKPKIWDYFDDEIDATEK